MEITEFSFPWDSENGDREYVAEDFRRYYKSFISSGLFMAVSTNLQVVENTGLTVKIKAGSAIIDGTKYDNEGDILVTIPTPDGLYDRIDRIVISWDKEEREVSWKLLEGTPAASPTAPDVRRTTDIKDYVLADILVQAGTAEISQADITDKRMDSNVCGVAVPFAAIDLSSLSAQYEAWIRDATAQGDAEAYALLEEMRDILDGSAAGHLQNEIDDHEDRLSRLEHMLIDNEIECPVTDDDGTVITDDAGRAICADWKYQKASVTPA